MLFAKRSIIIFITRSQIKAAVFSSRGKQIKEIGKYTWTKETLPGILKDISAQGPSRTRVVFGEGFSYVASVPSIEIDREKVLKEVQEAIPEILGDNWDFKKEDTANQSLQIAAIQKIFFDALKKGFDAVGLLVEAAEPQSLAIARLLPKSGAHVFISKEERVLFGAVKNGAVVGTYVCDSDKALSVFPRFLVFAEKRCEVKPQTVYLSSAIDSQSDVFSKSGFKIESADLDPLRGMAMKKHLTGRDVDVMNIIFSKEQIKKEKTFSIVSKREKVLGLIFLAGIILAAIALVIKFLKK